VTLGLNFADSRCAFFSRGTGRVLRNFTIGSYEWQSLKLNWFELNSRQYGALATEGSNEDATHFVLFRGISWIVFTASEQLSTN
jgi:hypothetical protein